MTDEPRSEPTDAPLSARDLPAAPAVPLDVRDLPLGDIGENDNIRPAYHGIEQLADTIHVQGLLQPVVVRPTPEDAGHDKPFELVFGHRRLAAVRQLGWESIRAEVREVADDERLGQMIVENYQREELSPVAEARAIQALKHSTDPPLSNAEVGRRLGIHPTQVTKRLNLLVLAEDAPDPAREAPGVADPEPPVVRDEEAPVVRDPEPARPSDPDVERPSDPEVAAPADPETPARKSTDIDILQAIDDGDISASAAEVIVSLPDHANRQKLAKLVVRNGWTVAKAQTWANKVKAEEGAEAQTLEEIPPAEVLRPSDITELARLRLREDLSEEEVGRLTCWALLRNGMDIEMLEYLDEEMGFPYEALWDYVASLSPEQVAELTRRLTLRYASAAHRFHSLEPTLIEQLGVVEGPEQEQSALAAPDAGSWSALADFGDEPLYRDAEFEETDG